MSKYITCAKEGQTVIIRDRDKAVAQLSDDVTAKERQLVADGLMRLPERRREEWCPRCNDVLMRGWTEIVPGDGVRDTAAAVLDRYPLRATASFQLAAAMTWSRNRPEGKTFICADDRLCDAAAQAGFNVMRPKPPNEFYWIM